MTFQEAKNKAAIKHGYPDYHHISSLELPEYQKSLIWCEVLEEAGQIMDIELVKCTEMYMDQKSRLERWRSAFIDLRKKAVHN